MQSVTICRRHGYLHHGYKTRWSPTWTGKLNQRVTSKSLNDSGLQLAPEKRKLCIFRNKGSRIEKQWAININGKKITSEKAVKFLGLYFEADLKWSQVEAVRQRCIKPMAVISYLRTTWMGADPTILLQLYTALIRSRIEYGGFLFHSLIKGQMDMLEKMQCIAVTLTFGYMRTAPKNVMRAEAKVSAITFRLKFLCSNYLNQSFFFFNSNSGGGGGGWGPVGSTRHCGHQ
jgi:hypothetical protein